MYKRQVFESDVEPVTISDRYGEINIYMLPFVKPSLVKRVYPEEEIITYQDAVNVAVQHMQIDTDKRNILLAHQFLSLIHIYIETYFIRTLVTASDFLKIIDKIQERCFRIVFFFFDSKFKSCLLYTSRCV